MVKVLILYYSRGGNVEALYVMNGKTFSLSTEMLILKPREKMI